MAAYEYCTNQNIQDYMASAEYTHFLADITDSAAYLTLMRRSATEEVIGYIKNVVEAAIWQGWTAATAPDAIIDATTWLAICRILPRRDTPMAPGEETAMQKQCARVREWLEKIKDGELELAVDMVTDETEGFQMGIFGEDREPVF